MFSCSSSSMVDIENEVSTISGDLMYLARPIKSLAELPDNLSNKMTHCKGEHSAVKKVKAAIPTS